MKILFMCVANSARSQMAEGLAKSIFGSEAEIQSAGSQPTKVNPLAIKAMAEIGVDITKHYPKTYDQISPKFLVDMNYIITLCAEEVCPVVVSRTAVKLHWPFPDPAGQPGADEEQLQRFRVARDNIQKKIIEFKQSFGESK